MSDDVKLDTKNLDNLIKALKHDLSRARVGIIGGKTNRKDEAAIKDGRSISASWKTKKPKTRFEIATNAAIGALHEFGGKNLPMRSFLRMPISDKLQSYMEKSGAFDKDVLKDVLKAGSVTPWLKKVAVLAEKIVAEAFETGGFGKWPVWKDPNYKNGNNRLLDDTGQLKDSITSDVKESA